MKARRPGPNKRLHWSSRPHPPPPWPAGGGQASGEPRCRRRGWLRRSRSRSRTSSESADIVSQADIISSTGSFPDVSVVNLSTEVSSRKTVGYLKFCDPDLFSWCPMHCNEMLSIIMQLNCKKSEMLNSQLLATTPLLNTVYCQPREMRVTFWVLWLLYILILILVLWWLLYILILVWQKKQSEQD